jgi:hypothetical protein
MPVQINEVIIRAVVDNNSATVQGADTSKVTSQSNTDTEIAALVLEIIKEKNER